MELERVTVEGMNITGCEVRGLGSSLSMHACHVHNAAMAPPESNWRIQGVWAHSGAQALIEHCTVEKVPSGIAADGQGTRLYAGESWIRGNAACGVFVGYGAHANITLCSLDVHEDASQFMGLDMLGQNTEVVMRKCTAKGNAGYGVHVSDQARLVAEQVATQNNGLGAWLVEGSRSVAVLERCESSNETAYRSKQGGSIKTQVCWPDFSA